MDKTTLSLLEKAAKKRSALKSLTNAIRLVNGMGDGLDGLILEQYGRHCVAQIFDKKWLAQREVLTEFVADHCDCRYFIVKDRSESASSSSSAIKSHVWLGNGPAQTMVEENGLKFMIDLSDTLNSGLFLDMRRNRNLVGGLSRGRRVLNCFAYTCSFGVYCRAAGAAGVVNVDISKKYLERGRINYELNRLVPERNEFIRMDAVEYLNKAVKKENRFDLIILDPPSFARFEGRSFSVKNDMAHLIEQAMKVLNPGGILLVATNLSSMSHDALEDSIRAGSSSRRMKEIQRLGQDDDFVGSGLMPESYLAVLMVEF